MLVTERPGRLRVVTPTASCRSRSPACRRWTRATRAACSTSRSIRVRDEPADLLELLRAARDGGMNNTAVARGKFVDGAAPRVENVQVIYHQAPSLKSTLHYGGRLVFGTATARCS
jgi:glucose/arabinose dehydrogenase